MDAATAQLLAIAVARTAAAEAREREANTERDSRASDIEFGKVVAAERIVEMLSQAFGLVEIDGGAAIGAPGRFALYDALGNTAWISADVPAAAVEAIRQAQTQEERTAPVRDGLSLTDI